ncbi:MAG TPA: hypothetical protein VHN74_11480 [Candidatus Angelobacter sp.]|nr:hypothetical protein [Candidatus Angelobacter sp.]
MALTLTVPHLIPQLRLAIRQMFYIFGFHLETNIKPDGTKRTQAFSKNRSHPFSVHGIHGQRGALGRSVDQH